MSRTHHELRSHGNFARKVVATLVVAVALTSCSSSRTVGGSVTGLAGTGLVLQNNGVEDIRLKGGGTFAFRVAKGRAYNITVQTQPSYPAQDCVVANGSGTVGSANLMNVSVMCLILPVPEIQADAGFHEATITWNEVPQARNYNLLVSTEQHCDIRRYKACESGALTLDATSPQNVVRLRNAVPYYFRVETQYSNGARGVSLEVGARPNAPSFNGRVEALAVGSDGTVYVGGYFTEVGVTVGSGVPLDRTTGRLASARFSTVNGTVNATVSDGAGGWYIGGEFTYVGDAPRGRLAHIRADGTVDPDWSPNANQSVNAMALIGSTLFVGGGFTAIGDVTRNHLAAVDARGALLPWNPDADGWVDALGVSGNTVYVGGYFSFVGGAVRHRLAAIDADGAILPWAPEAYHNLPPVPHLILPSSVNSLAVSGSTVYVGGDFTVINGQQRAHLAAIDISGTVLPWNPGATGIVSAIAVFGSTVYAAGPFRNIAGTARNTVAAIDSSGALLPWDPNPVGSVKALAFSGHTIYLAGSLGSVFAP